MKKIVFLALSLSFLLANNKTIAILDFDVNDDLPKGLVQLGTAIPIFLISDLSEIKSLDIVERKKIQALLDEINLGDSKFMDKSTAQQLGNGLGAELIMTGAISLLFNTISIDARIIHVGTGEVLMAKSVRDEWDEKQWYNIYQKLPKLFVDNIEGVRLSRREQRSIEQPKPKTKSFDAAIKYSEAIDANDKEDYSMAASLLESAIDIDPEFDLAYEALETVEEKLKLLEKTRSSGLESKYLAMVERVSAGDRSVMNEVKGFFENSYFQLATDGGAFVNTAVKEKTYKPGYEKWKEREAEIANSKDYYEVLGVSKNANDSEIEKCKNMINVTNEYEKACDKLYFDRSGYDEKGMVNYYDDYKDSWDPNQLTAADIWNKNKKVMNSSIVTMKTIIDIANENGLINEKDQNKIVGITMYNKYLQTLMVMYNYSRFGRNFTPPIIMNFDIPDANGKIIIYANEVPDILIEEGTMMMKKYPTASSIEYLSFKAYVEAGLEYKKK